MIRISSNVPFQKDNGVDLIFQELVLKLRLDAEVNEQAQDVRMVA